jgi:hypothetical protein
MKPVQLSLVTLCVVSSLASAFAPRPALSSTGGGGALKFSTARSTPGAQPLFGFMGDKERDQLTRDSEPEDFFRTYVRYSCCACLRAMWYIAEECSKGGTEGAFIVVVSLRLITRRQRALTRGLSMPSLPI